MKKFFSFILALTAAVTMNATQVVFNPASMTAVASNGAINEVVSGVTLACPKGLVNDSQIRVYANQTLTISSESAISAIVMTCAGSGTAQYGPGLFTTTGNYAVNENVGTWLGSANSNVFSCSAQVRMTKVVVYLDGEVPAADTWVPDTIGVSEARALIATSDAHSHYVYGKVYQIDDYTANYKNVNVWLSDLENPTDTLEGFKMKGLDNADIPSLDALEYGVGDTVLFFTTELKNYNGTYEMNGGRFVEVLGSASGVPTEITFTNGVVEYDDADEKVTINLSNNGIEALSAVLRFDCSNIAKFAGEYTLSSNSYLNVAQGVQENIEGITATLTFIKVEDDAHIYKVAFRKETEDATYIVNCPVALICEDPDFGAYDDGRAVRKLTASRAAQETAALADKVASEELVYVYGYCVNIVEQIGQFGNAQFDIADEVGGEGVFQAYRCYPEGEISAVVEGQLYVIKGHLIRYGSTYEISKEDFAIADALPEDIIDADPELQPEKVSAEKAYQIGMALPDPTEGERVESEKPYIIIGIINEKNFEAYDPAYKNQSWLMANTADYEDNMIRIYRAKPDTQDFAPGDTVAVEAKISKYNGGTYMSISTVAGGKAYRTEEEIPDDLTALPEVLMEASKARAIKTIENGRLVIVKDGVQYNVLGTKF